MLKIYLFRHGKTYWNEDKTIKYSEEARDCLLSELGRKQAEELAIKCKDYGIQHIYTSNLKRTKETGKIIADILNIKTEEVNGLEEFSIYDDTLIGLTSKEIKEKIGLEDYKKCKNTKDELLDWRPLDCETKREARNRIVKTIDNICKTTKYEIIGIVSHGGIIKEFLKNYDFENYLRLANCEIVEIEYKNGAIDIKKRIENIC